MAARVRQARRRSRRDDHVKCELRSAASIWSASVILLRFPGGGRTGEPSEAQRSDFHEYRDGNHRETSGHALLLFSPPAFQLYHAVVRSGSSDSVSFSRCSHEAVGQSPVTRDVQILRHASLGMATQT